MVILLWRRLWCLLMLGHLMFKMMTHNLFLEFLSWTLKNPLHELESSMIKKTSLERLMRVLGLDVN